MASFMQSCFHKKFHFKILLSASKIFLCLLPGSFHFLFFGQNDQKWNNQLSCLFIFCMKIRFLLKKDSLLRLLYLKISIVYMLDYRNFLGNPDKTS